MGASVSALNKIFTNTRIRPLYFKTLEHSIKNSNDEGLKSISKAIRMEVLTRNDRNVITEMNILKASICVKHGLIDDARKITEKELKNWPNSFRLQFLKSAINQVKPVKKD